MRVEYGSEKVRITLPEAPEPPRTTPFIGHTNRRSRVLLATDGSAEAEPATHAAVEQADATGSELHVVYVGRLPNFLMQDPDVVGHDCRLYDYYERESREMLRKITWRVKVAGGTVASSHLRMGRPENEIVRLGEEIGASVIVVGSRGRSRLTRLLAGSVSDSVVRHAPCPVLVVRPDTFSSTATRRG
jgi:nucleotide-binding universal stress UspA family protein